MRSTCLNCKASQDKFWWIPLCKDCRRAIQVAGIIGGLLCGAAVKLLTLKGWM